MSKYKAGVDYQENGIQQRGWGQPPLLMATDIAVTRSSFCREVGEPVDEPLEALRARFKAGRIERLGQIDFFVPHKEGAGR